MKFLRHLALTLALLAFANALPLRAQNIVSQVLDFGSSTTGDTGQHTSQAIVNGNPAIAYYDVTAQDLRYVRATDATGTSWGTPVSLDTAINSGQYTSLAVVNGNPAISYYDATTFDLKYVRATDVNGTTWGTPVTADGTGFVGQYTSLAVVNGNPAISYYDSVNGDLKYVRATDVNGTTWGTVIALDTTISSGQYCSLAVVDGQPAISYFNGTSGDLKFVRALDADGTTWGTPLSLETSGFTGLYTSLKVVNGNPAIAYFNNSGPGLRYIRASDTTGTTWGSAAVSIDTVVAPFYYVSLAVINDQPAVTYYNSTSKDLQYVRANNANGTTWGTPVVLDSTGDVGQYTSLTAVNGNPAVSYYDLTNGNLKWTTILPAPTVTAISPASGSMLGSTSVTITGTNLTGATAVTIGGTAATLGTNTGTTLSVITGAHAAGAGLSVLVTTPSGTNAANTLFTYMAPPTVTSSTTNLTASSTITITGTGFSTTPGNNTVVFSNGAVGTVIAATATQLTVVLSTQPTSAGAFTVVVTTNGQSSGSAVQVATVIQPYEYQWTNFAGQPGSFGSTNGTGSAARFNGPSGVAVDGSGNLYVADYGNHTIRKITSGGVVTTLAGTPGSSGSADGTGSAAQFNGPQGVAADGSGNVYVADTLNNTIRKISSGGVVTTLAGTAGSPGSTDATGSAARFDNPLGVAVDNSGNVYVADAVNHTIRKITSGGVVTTLAGTAGGIGSTDATGGAALFGYTGGVAVDSSGNVYVADVTNSTIRKITSGGVVTTLAGTAGSFDSVDGTGSAARFYTPRSVAVDSSGNVYVADQGNHTIRKITSGGVVTTVGGTAGVVGGADGLGALAQFSNPQGVAVDSSGNLYVADYTNCRITQGIAVAWPAPIVDNIAPQVGVTAGGTTAVIFGSYFTGATGVTIGGTAATNVSVLNDSMIVCTTPPGALGTASVLVTTPGGTSAANTLYSYNSPPVITSNGGDVTAIISVPENTTAVTTVTATDADLPAQTIAYSKSGPDAFWFNLDSSTGVLAFFSPPDYEGPHSSTYLVTVTATDNGTPNVNCSQDLMIVVTNVNETPAISSLGGGDGATANLFLHENATAVATITTVDPDGGMLDTVLSGPDAALFSYDIGTGALAFLAAPDFEGPHNEFYHITVTTTDDGTPVLSAAQVLTIRVWNVDEPPSITSNGDGEPASFDFPENGTAVITTVTATDPDADNFFNFGITGPDAAYFTIHPYTGELRFIDPPNYEIQLFPEILTRSLYQVTVIAYGNSTFGYLTDTQDLTINVTNVNEPPKIQVDGDNGYGTSGGHPYGHFGGPSNPSIPENSTDDVTTVIAFDPDPGTILSFSKSGPDAAFFAINASTGVLRFINPPDYESAHGPAYHVTIIATDDGMPVLSFSQDFTVNVLDVNEAPVITSNGGGATATITIPENTTAVTTVTATDQDADPLNSMRVFGLISTSGTSDSDNYFHIDSASGALTFMSPPDYEDPLHSPVYQLTVVVLDGTYYGFGSFPMFDTQDITVTVTNANDAPAFTKGANQTIGLTTAPQTVPGWATAISDGDSTVTQALHFTVTEVGSSGLFTTAPAISSNGTLTYTPGSAQGIATFSVVLTDDNTINGTAARTSPPQTFTISRTPEIAIEQPLGTLRPAARIVAWGNNEELQTDVPTGLTGVKSVAVGGFHTVALKHDGTVVAWGNNFKGQTDVPANLTGVTAVAASMVRSVALKGDGTVVTWGEDYGMPANLTGVTAIADGQYHTVALKSDGTVVAWGFPGDNGQSTPPPGLTGVTAIAAGHYHSVALKSDGTVVTWGYDNGGAAVLAALTGVTAISAGANHTVALKSDGTVVACGDNFRGQTDVPAGLTGVTAIAAGQYHTVALKSDGTVVAWGSNLSGQTTVPEDLRGMTSLAQGPSASHVVAYSGSMVSFGAQTVANTSAAKTFTIKNIGVAATLNISSVSVTGGNASDFTVSTAGMLTSLPLLTGQTTFTVTFTPGATGTRQTTLRVVSNDADEGNYDITLMGTGAVPPNAAPVITSNGGLATASINVPENTTAVTTVIATDADLPAQKITYSKSGTDASLFNLDSGTGALSFIAAPDFETTPGPFSVTVTATDNGTPNVSNSQALTISVTDVNEAPVINSNLGGPTASISIAENTTGVTTVTATDVDLPAQTLTFSKSGTDAALFTLTTGGVLSFTAAPDFEGAHGNTYAVTVTATDNGSSNLSDTQDLTITVTNVNDPPTFTKGANKAHPFLTSGAQSFSAWATAINDGDSTMVQALTFNTSNDNAALFTTAPAISSSGDLSYTLSGNSGTAIVSVTLTDDASIDGAALTTAAQTFTITVAPNTPPVVTVDGVGALKLTTLVHFTGDGGANPGATPTYGDLIQGSDGNFYGMTQSGGTNDLGTVFKMTASGVLTTLVNFDSTNGAYPQGSLVQGSDGDFYGMTFQGGTGNRGTAFKMTASGALTTLVNFDYPTNGGYYPQGSLVQGSDGDFYGMTFQGGRGGLGTVFKMTATGGLTTLVSFDSSNGAYPKGSLVQGSDGDFYGMTFQGGTGGLGTAFKMTATGGLTTLVSFSGANGKYPFGSLVQGSDGDFYGMTSEAGTNSNGTAFKMTATGGLTTLVNFAFSNGANPQGSLVEGSDGAFYGMTAQGGTGDGTVFRMTASGVVTTLVNFAFSNGSGPWGSLVQVSDGGIYGMTTSGGTSLRGTVFKLGDPQVVTTTAEGSLATQTGTFSDAEGHAVILAASSGTLTQDKVAGTWSWSATGADGPATSTVTITATDSLSDTSTALFTFSVTNALPVVTIDAPATALQGASVAFAFNATDPSTVDQLAGFAWELDFGDGTTESVDAGTTSPLERTHTFAAPGTYTVTATATDKDGGTSDQASQNITIIPVAPTVAVDGAGPPILTTLVNFTGNGGANPGASPVYGHLIQGSDGDFYGMTYGGGTSVWGTAFKMTASGALTTLVNFNYSNGGSPSGSLVQGSDGGFYGMTIQGGTDELGTAFKMTADGALTTLVSFDYYTKGAYPQGSLVQGSDGDFYGMTQQGGTGNRGTVFKMTATGVLTTLVNFDSSNGAYPYGSLVQGSDGDFYGMTQEGGKSGAGTVFKMTASGVLTTLVNFNSSNGAYPLGSLVQGSDGDFYGMTTNGGTNDQGTAFKMTASGGLTTLLNFTGANGAYPSVSLVQGSDGDFYGMTSNGGANDLGTAFKMTASGGLTTLVSFDYYTNGGYPSGSLVQGSDGSFYGMTNSGGTDELGTVFKLVIPPAVLVATVAEGAPAAVTGTFSDAQGNATVLLTASGGAITQDNTAGTWSWSATDLDGPSTSTVTITATDTLSHEAPTAFTLILTNVAPTFELGDNDSLPVGTAALTRNVSFADPGADIWSGTVDYGDGSGAAALSVNQSAKTFALSHTYTVSGTFTVSVTLSDDDGGTATDSYTLTTLLNRAPTDISLSPSSIAENNAANATVGSLTATDADVGDTHTFTLVTGDGSTDNGSFTIVGNALKITPSADFETRSSYTVRVRATDAGLLAFEKGFTITITNVNEMPSFTKGANQLLPNATATAQSVSTWATAIDDGDSTDVQALTFNITGNTTPGIFTTPPSIASNGTLTYTPNGTTGTSTITVTLTDDASINSTAALTTAVQTFTITVEAAPNYSVSTTGNAILVTDLSGNGDTLAVSEPSAGSILFTATGRTFSVNGALQTTGSSGNVSLTSVTSITVNAAAGVDIINVGAFSGTNFPSLTLNGGIGDDTVNLNGDITFAANANLDLDLQNDSVPPGIDVVNLATNANLITSGTGTITVKVSRNVVMTAGASFETVNGGITIEANQQTTPTTGTFSGISVLGGTIKTSGTGALALRGKSGLNATTFVMGVDIFNSGRIQSTSSAPGAGTIDLTGQCADGSTNGAYGVSIGATGSTVSSAAGNIHVTGNGGNSTGQSTQVISAGLRVNSAGTITATGTAAITVDATSGTVAVGASYTIDMRDTSTAITAVNGNIDITATDGNAPASTVGLYMTASAQIATTGSGAILINATSGNASASGSATGLFMTASAQIATTSSGTILINATGGNAPASTVGLYMTTSAQIATTGSGTITMTGSAGTTSATSFAQGLRVDAPAQISSTTGKITLTGNGGTSPGILNHGASIRGNVTATSTGNVTINGIAGTPNAVAGSGSQGVQVRGGAIVSSAGGNVALNGTSANTTGNEGITIAIAGTGTVSIADPAHSITAVSDSIFIDATNGSLNAGTGSVTLRQKTNALLIDLGAADSATTLGLTDAELDRITAGTLNIGNANSGAITVSDAVSPRAYKTLAFGKNTSFGSAGGFVSDIGATASVFEKISVVGTVAINGTASLSTAAFGGFVPVLGNSFKLIDNDGTSDALTGTFASLPEGATLANYLGSGLSAHISYLGGDGNDVVITVQNVEPIITSDDGGATASINVAENTTAVTTVTATDADAAQTKTFTKTGTDAALFTLDSSGVLSFTDAPDFEGAHGNTYAVTVIVTDNGTPNLSDSQAISITVTNSNEAPLITSNSGGAKAAINVAENSTAVTTVTGTDVDAGQPLTFSKSGDDEAFFTLDSSTGALSFASAPDFETLADANNDGVYEVTVIVTDNGDSTLSDSQAISVTVTNVNELPSFAKGGDQLLPSATSSAQTISEWATTIDDGDSSVTQDLSFTVTEIGSSGLFATAPSIDSKGTLTYTPNGTAGSATFEVSLTDDNTINSTAAITTDVQSFTITIQPAPDYTVSTSGNVMVVTDMAGNGETLTLSAAQPQSITFTATGRTFSINGGLNREDDSGSLSRAGISSIIVNAAVGDDMINVESIGSDVPNLTINGGTGNDTVNLNASLSFVTDANLDLDLQNDSDTPGTDSVNVAIGANITTSGTGSITVKVSQKVVVATKSKLATANGGITLEANQQAVTTVGNFSGVALSGTLSSTGTGPISLTGKGGDTNGSNHGIVLGVLDTEPGFITSTGSGSVTLVGQGGTGSDGDNDGIVLFNAPTNSSISSDGPITMTGIAGSDGDIGTSEALNLLTGPTITATNTATITLIADQALKLDSTINAGTHTVTLKQKTNGTAITLGSYSATMLGFADEGLDHITAGMLIIGDTNSGAITVDTILSPASYKTLTFGNHVSFTASSGFESDIGPTASDYEKIKVIGTATIAAGSTLNLATVDGYIASAADSFTFLDNDGTEAIVGTFTGPTLTNFLGSSLTAAKVYNGGTGNDLVITNALPEPGSLLRVALGAPKLNPNTGLMEYIVRVTNDSGARIEGVRLTLTNLITPYQLWNKTHPTLPIIEVVQTLVPNATLDVKIAIYSPTRILASWVPIVTAVPMAAMTLDPMVVTKPSAATRYDIIVTTAGVWSVTESLPWVSVSTLDGFSNGNLTVTLQANPSLAARTGIIKIGALEHRITQAGVLRPIIGSMAASYPAVIRGAFTLAIPTQNLPITRYTVTGLPAGLKLSNATGIITGVPTKVGSFPVTVKATNAAGTSNTAAFRIVVGALPEGIAGTFTGFVERSATVYVGPLPNLGARFSMLVSATGDVSGKLIDGLTIKPFTSKVVAWVADLDHPTFSVAVPGTALTLTLELDASSQTAYGWLHNAAGTQQTAVDAWRNGWHVATKTVPAHLATTYKGLHNIALFNTSSQGPLGTGYASFTVNENTGALTIFGKLADGSVLTGTTFIGQGGQVLLYQMLYANKGSCLGRFEVSFTGTHTVRGSLTWLKPASTTDTLYRAGFGRITLGVDGGAYTPPAAGDRVMNLPAATAPNNNATLKFRDGLMGGLSFDQALRINSTTGPGNTVTLSILNSNQVTLTLNALTGALSGGFTLTGTTPALNRQATFDGLIVKSPTSNKGVGFFLVPQVPGGTQTVNTAPKISGLFQLAP